MPGPSVTVRIGVIGTGFGRRVQLPALRLVTGAEVAAVASGSLERARAVAKEFDIPQAFGSGEELARASDVDLVIVSSTPDAHLRHAVAALEVGKHVLCEKPMALTAREAEQMIEVAAKSSSVARIDHELRYEPNRRKARELIRAGAIGAVWHIEFVLKPYLRGDGRPQALDAPWSWWYDAARGGGILGAVGSHVIDLCRFWTGMEVVDVQGGVETMVRERLDEQHVPRPVTADDVASFVLRLEGAVATVTLSTVAAHGPGHFAQVTGSEGTLMLTGETKLEIGRRAAELEDISAPDDLWERTSPNNMWARSFVRLMRDLVGVVGGRRATGEPATFHDGLAVQRVIDAVRAGRGVRLD